MKATNLRDGSRDRPTLDTFNLRFGNLDSFSEDSITKENNLRSKELTLLKFSKYCLLS